MSWRPSKEVAWDQWRRMRGLLQILAQASTTVSPPDLRPRPDPPRPRRGRRRSGGGSALRRRRCELRNGRLRSTTPTTGQCRDFGSNATCSKSGARTTSERLVLPHLTHSAPTPAERLLRVSSTWICSTRSIPTTKLHGTVLNSYPESLNLYPSVCEYI